MKQIGKAIHVFLSVACYGGNVKAGFMRSVLDLQLVCMKAGVQLGIGTVTGDALIPRARANGVRWFMENPAYTHLLIIDADVVFDAEVILRFLRSSLPVCYGMVPFKQLYQGEDGIRAIAPVNQIGVPDPKVEWMEAEFCGTGFSLYKREVIEALFEKFSDLKYGPNLCGLFNPIVETDRLLSDDYAFCKRIREAGFKVMVDQHSKFVHLGEFAYGTDVLPPCRKSRRGDTLDEPKPQEGLQWPTKKTS